MYNNNSWIDFTLSYAEPKSLNELQIEFSETLSQALEKLEQDESAKEDIKKASKLLMQIQGKQKTQKSKNKPFISLSENLLKRINRYIDEQ